MTLRNRHLASGLLLLLAAPGCNWGTRPKDYAPAMGPEGARIAVRERGESTDRIGELYAVDSAGIIFYYVRLRRVSWTRLEAMDVKSLGSEHDVSRGEMVDAAKRERLAALSRFPQGLSGDLLRAVLQKTGQSEIEEDRP